MNNTIRFGYWLVICAAGVTSAICIWGAVVLFQEGAIGKYLADHGVVVSALAIYALIHYIRWEKRN